MENFIFCAVLMALGILCEYSLNLGYFLKLKFSSNKIMLFCNKENTWLFCEYIQG